MVVLTTKWQGHPVNVGLCHCPSNHRHWKWDLNTREATLLNILGAVGAQHGGSGVSEPTAWILGGDFNCGPNYLSNHCVNYQQYDAEGDYCNKVQFVVSKTTGQVEPGDIALVQGLRAYQVQTTVGTSFGRMSDAHELVVVPVSLPDVVFSSSGENAPAKSAPCGKPVSLLDAVPRSSGENAPAKPVPCINDKNDNEQETADDSGGRANDASVDLSSTSDVSPGGKSFINEPFYGKPK